MTDSCYLDTTILIEALLKTRRRRQLARAAIQAYKRSLLPAYAIKEMSAGALSYAVWLYNLLSETRSLTKTYDRIAANIRNPNRVTTALELLHTASETITGVDLADARTFAKTDRMQADMHALALRRIIVNGWRDRRKVASVIQELACFPDEGPYMDEELKIMKPGRAACPAQLDCSYAKELRGRPRDLSVLLEVIMGSDRNEDVRRRAALHALKNTPRRQFDNKMCRKLGDAYFALNCPGDATILTSNAKDHAPLAGALGKTVTAYRWKDK
jgi:hypothetical protein